MKTEVKRNTRLGVLIIVGASLLVAGLYFIGDKQNLFGSTIRIKARFTNVNGLTVGNNVRYVGIDVGTVNDIHILNDSSVYVEMTIKSDAVNYIRKNAIASIGTDGLMGNKLVNINSTPGNADYIQEGDILQTVAPLETEEIMRTLSHTNDDMSLIAENLKSITAKIEEENMIWNLLKDTVIANNLRRTLINVKSSSADISSITKNFEHMSKHVKGGNGLMGTLLYDTTFMFNMNSTINSLKSTSDSLSIFSSHLGEISRHIKTGQGAAGKVLMDEQFENDLNETLMNIKNASKSLDENMEALKHSVLLKKYYKKQKKDSTKLN